MDVVNVKIKDINPYENNPRLNKDAVKYVEESIKHYGFKVPLVIDKNNVIVTGHTRYKAAKKLKLKELPCVIADDLTEEQVKAFRIADNKVSEYSEWDMDLLNIEFEHIDDDLFTGFDDFDFEEEESIVEEDNFEEPLLVKPVSKKGDIWILGKHRLMCGDSTGEDVSILMGGEKADMALTDPPYNTGMKESPDSTRLNHMFNDSFTEEEWQKLLKGFTKKMCESLKDNSVAYVFLDWRRSYELIPHLKKYFKMSNLIIWDKMVHGLGSDYKYTHEFIHVCKKGKPLLDTHQGEREYSDVWHIQRKLGKDEDHATKKPLELCIRPLRHASKKGDIILDLFGGSGSTLIACEQMKRHCYMMELDEKYVDVIVRRYVSYVASFENVKLLRDGKEFSYEEMFLNYSLEGGENHE